MSNKVQLCILYSFFVFILMTFLVIFPYPVNASIQGKSSLEKAYAKQEINCLECHAGSEFKMQFPTSVHGKNGCTSCHTGVTDIEKHMRGVQKPKLVSCQTCHNAMTPRYIHRLHAGADSCTTCHKPHLFIPAKKNCQQCHTSQSILITKPKPAKYSLINWKVTNKELMDKGLYVVGCNRIPGLDVLGILVVVFTLLGCIGHGILRFFGRIIYFFVSMDAISSGKRRGKDV